MVIDTYLQSPPFSGLGIPGPDGDFYDVGPNGLPDVAEEDVAKMSEDTRRAFLTAKQSEREWKDQWQSEAADGARAKIKINYTGVPV